MLVQSRQVAGQQEEVQLREQDFGNFQVATSRLSHHVKLAVRSVPLGAVLGVGWSRTRPQPSTRRVHPGNANRAAGAALAEPDLDMSRRTGSCLALGSTQARTRADACGTLRGQRRLPALRGQGMAESPNGKLQGRWGRTCPHPGEGRRMQVA